MSFSYSTFATSTYFGEFFLWIDASEKGFGAVLEQEGSDKLQNPVA